MRRKNISYNVGVTKGEIKRFQENTNVKFYPLVGEEKIGKLVAFAKKDRAAHMMLHMGYPPLVNADPGAYAMLREGERKLAEAKGGIEMISGAPDRASLDKAIEETIGLLESAESCFWLALRWEVDKRTKMAKEIMQMQGSLLDFAREVGFACKKRFDDFGVPKNERLVEAA